MAAINSFNRIAAQLNQNLASFAGADYRFRGWSDGAVAELKARWQSTLEQDAALAGFAAEHDRLQTPASLELLRNLAELTATGQNFRLSLLGTDRESQLFLASVLMEEELATGLPGEMAPLNRIRLIFDPDRSGWKIVYLTPARFWETGCRLLAMAGMTISGLETEPTETGEIIARLEQALLEGAQQLSAHQDDSPELEKAETVAETLAEMIRAYREAAVFIAADPAPLFENLPETYLDGGNRHLLVDYIEHYPAGVGGGLLDGRNLELELLPPCLPDARSLLFAREAFQNSLAVILHYNLQQEHLDGFENLGNLPGNTDPETVRQYFRRGRLLLVADSDLGTDNHASSAQRLSRFIDSEDYFFQLLRYQAPLCLVDLATIQASRRFTYAVEIPDGYFENFLDRASEMATAAIRQGLDADYLEFLLDRQADFTRRDQFRAEYLELVRRACGLNRLETLLESLLDTGTALQQKLAEAEYTTGQVVTEFAFAYAHEMRKQGLEFTELPRYDFARHENRRFLEFQLEMRQRLRKASHEHQEGLHRLSRLYSGDRLPPEALEARQDFLDTVQKVFLNDRMLSYTQLQLSTGENILEHGRKAYEEINDWLVLEAGRQMRHMVGRILAEIERLDRRLLKQIEEIAAGVGEETLRAAFRQKEIAFKERVLSHAETLAIGYYIENRRNSSEPAIIEILRQGRREQLARLVQEQFASSFLKLWAILLKVVMTEISAYASSLRHSLLGLEPESIARVGLEMEGGQSAPESSILSLLCQHYQQNEEFRQGFERRETAPAQKLAYEIYEWFALLKPPYDGKSELARAFALTATPLKTEQPQPETTVPRLEVVEGEIIAAEEEALANPSPVFWLRVPIESSHPYNPLTRQDWEITNPDVTAAFTRVHFRRVDLTSPNDRIILKVPGRREELIVTGRESDFWTMPLKGRAIKIIFSSNNPTPGWGFILDGIESLHTEQEAEKHSTR